MLRVMDEHNVERAVVLPINYPDYFPLEPQQRADWLRANNDQQAAIARASERRLVAFADCAIDGAYAQPARGIEELRRAIGELGLAGLKIHGSNLKTSVDDGRLLSWVAAASELGVPVVFHSNPSGHDPDFHGTAPSRIYKAVFGRDVTYVIAHMGGVSFFEILGGGGYVDISAAFLMIGQFFDPPATTRLLRSIGIHRLLFATDYPIYTYEAYERVFDTMDLETDELERIAFRNAERMLDGQPPLESE
jgi:predicted TIM-barrel fold metal-dependent hydrolase